MADRLTIIKPKSTKEVAKYLKPPLSKTSVVIYFAEKDNRPFMLDAEGGISPKAEYRLSRPFEALNVKLDRITIMTMDTGIKLGEDE